MWCGASRIVSPGPRLCTAPPQAFRPARECHSRPSAVSKTLQLPKNRTTTRLAGHFVAADGRADVTMATRRGSLPYPANRRTAAQLRHWATLAHRLLHLPRTGGKGEGQLRQRTEHRGTDIRGGGLATPLDGPRQSRREVRSWQWLAPSLPRPAVYGQVGGPSSIPPQGGNKGGNPATPVAGAPMEAPDPTPAGRGPSSLRRPTHA